MKVLSCKDMGAEGCNFVAKGATNEEVMKAMTEHAQSMHPDKMKEMSEKNMSQDDMMKMMMGAIKEE